MSMPRDAVVGMVVLALAGLYWRGAGTIRHSSLDDPIGAAGLPNTLAAALAVLAVLLIARALLVRPRPARDQAGAAGATEGPPREHLRALGMLALGVVYLLIIPTLGYALSIALLLGAVALYNRHRPTPGLAVFAVLGAAGFYVLFVEILSIPLPAGIWPSVLPV